MSTNQTNQGEAIDYLNGVAKKLFYDVLESEMKTYIEKNKDRIIAEVILRISKEMSIERFGPVVRFEINTESNQS